MIVDFLPHKGWSQRMFFFVFDSFFFLSKAKYDESFNKCQQDPGLSTSASNGNLECPQKIHNCVKLFSSIHQNIDHMFGFNAEDLRLVQSYIWLLQLLCFPKPSEVFSSTILTGRTIERWRRKQTNTHRHRMVTIVVYSNVQRALLLQGQSLNGWTVHWSEHQSFSNCPTSL